MEVITSWMTKQEVADFINSWLVTPVKPENITEVSSDGKAESLKTRVFATVSEGRVIVVTDNHNGSPSIRTVC